MLPHPCAPRCTALGLLLRRFNTFEGHEWSVQDAAGTVVAQFTVAPGDGEQTFTISSGATGGSPRPRSRPSGARPPM